MKKNNILQYVVLLLISFFALPFAVNAEVTEWSTADALPSSNGSFKLASNVTVSSVWDLTGKDITIDLNGKSITTTQKISVIGGGKLTIIDSSSEKTGAIVSSVDPAILVQDGIFTMNSGTLKVSAEWGYGVLLKGTDANDAQNYSVFNFGENAKLKTIDKGYTYAVAVGGVNNKANGVVVNLKGDIDIRLADSSLKEADVLGVYINGKFNSTEGNVPVINIYDTASIDATLPSQTATMSSAVLYAAGYAKWNIYGGVFKGQEGFSIKAGEFNITGGNLEVYGNYVNPAVANNDGTEDTGAAISITSNVGYAHSIKMNITGGTFISKNGNALYEGIASNAGVSAAPNTYVSVLNISGGAYKGNDNKDAIYVANFADIATKNVIGGYYSTNPAAYKNSSKVVIDNDGSVVSNADYKYAISSTYGKMVSDDDKTVSDKVVTYDPSSSKGLVLVFNGLAANFKDLYIDGNLVPTDMYTVESGSTIITIKQEYLKNLKSGSHAVKVDYLDGSITTTIKTLEENPATYDGILYFLGLLSISIVGTFFGKKYIKAKIN